MNFLKNKSELVFYVCIPVNLIKESFTNISKISNSAAKADHAIQYITFDSTLKTISSEAFKNCPELQIIEFNFPVKKKGEFNIQTSAFENCQKLQTVILGKFPGKDSEHKKKDYSSFDSSTNLLLERYSFANCPSLRTVVFPNCNVQIHDEAFFGFDSELLTFIVNKNPNVKRFAREHNIRCVYADRVK